MLTPQQQAQHAAFQAAKKIALNIPAGHYRRASVDGVTVKYYGFKHISGRMWVIGDSDAEIQNPDARIQVDNELLPAREIFGDFTIMTR